MFSGNWSCSSCGGAITQLPFQPDPERVDSLKCRDCFSKNKGGDRRGSGSRDRGPRQMFSGDWSCASCGKAITELPFQPDPARVDSLKCRDCHSQDRRF